MLKKEEYPYFRDKYNHKHKMEEYYRFLDKNKIIEFVA